ncbi:MAG: Snf7 family protein [Candidatus Thorarchaeota archaeon]
MAFKKFGRWVRGGSSSRGSPTRRWIVRLRMIERRMGRQRQKLKSEEKKMMREVESAVNKGDMDEARLYAKDVAKTRKMALTTQKIQSRVKAMTFKLEQAHAMESMSRDMVGLVRALRSVNATLRIPQLENVIVDMESEMTQLDMATEAIDEGLEMTDLGADEIDADVEKIIGELSAGRAATAAASLPTADIKSQEIQKELEKLKSPKQD